MKQEHAAQGMRAFMTIWLGELVSVIGTGLTGFSLGVWVFQRTGSPTLFALIALFTTLPGILVSPVAGTLVDRWDLRKTMLFSDMGAALATLAIALLLMADRLEIWHIYVAMSVASIFTAFQRPAYKVAATLLVPQEQYAQASGLMQAGFGSQFIISPILAGLLIGPIGIQGIILVDFITFFVAVFTLMLVRIPRAAATSEGSVGKGSLLRETAQVWHYLKARPGLIGVLAVLTVGNFMISFVAVLAAPMMLTFTNPTVLGITMSTAGMGMLIGSIVLGVKGGPRRLVRGMTLCMLAGGLGVALMGLRENVVLITAACFIFFFTMPFVQGCHETILRKKVVHDIQGRMFASTSGLIMLASTLAYVLAGPLSEYLFEPLVAPGGPLAASVGSVIGTGPGRGIGLLFLVAGTLAMLVTLLGYLHPRVRNLETELPDVITDAGEPVHVPAPQPAPAQQPAVKPAAAGSPARPLHTRHDLSKEDSMNETVTGADRSIWRWGGIASLLVPIAFAWVGIFLMIDPAEQFRDERYWIFLAEQPIYTYSWRFAFFLVAILTLAIIPAIVRLVRSPDGYGEGLLQWMTVLAYLGMASLAIDCMRGIFLMKDYLITAYLTNDEMMKVAAKLAISGGTDVNSVFQFGGTGLWFITIGFLALRNARMPRTLAYFGVLTGVTYVVVLFWGLLDTFMPGTNFAIMAIIASVGGVVVAPVFHIWLGRFLLRRAAHPRVEQPVAPQQVAPAEA